MNCSIRITGTLFLLLGLSSVQLVAQVQRTESDSVYRKRLIISVSGGGAVMATTYTSLYFLWYDDFPQSGFHWINDNREWLQMDKIGHATTSYHLSRFTHDVLRWSGVNDIQSTFYGSLTGFVGISIIDVFDGFSSEWGASSGDLLANFSGSALFSVQQLVWNEQRLSIKASFHRTEFPAYRPDLLGENFVQETVKDYNGQTYWLSVNIASFLQKESRFPKWINLAVGIGADGMLGANENPDVFNNKPLPAFDRKRQFYLSADLDLNRIPVRNKGLKSLFSILNIVKVPFPAIEFNHNGKVKGYLLYF